MSKPLENRSQTSKEMEVDYQSPALHSELFKIIKSMVTESIFPVKLPQEVQVAKNTSGLALVVLPISISRPQELDAIVATPDTATRKRPRMTTSIVVEKRCIALELPKGCIIDQIDMDKLPSVDGNNIPLRRLSFRERLEGWSIERRQRPNKTFDVFYYHPKSSRMFRSTTEVVKFILYEVYPNYQRKENRLTLIENLDKHKTSEEPATIKRKCMSNPSDDDRRKKENARKVLEKFLEEAYNNLMNYGCKISAQYTGCHLE